MQTVTDTVVKTYDNETKTREKAFCADLFFLQ